MGRTAYAVQKLRCTFLCSLRCLMFNCMVPAWGENSPSKHAHCGPEPNSGRARLSRARRFHFASAARRAGYIYMRIAPFLEDFAVRRQGVPVLSGLLYECSLTFAAR